MECCGIQFEHDGHLRLHTRSVLHKQHGRLRALLDQQCLTYTEMGRRLNLTRERIRQYANSLGLQRGRRRQAACRYDARMAALRNPTLRIGRFILNIESRGLEWTPIAKTAGGFVHTEILVCGRRVLIRTASYRDLAWGSYVTICGPRTSTDAAEIIAYELPTGSWLLLPWERKPATQTMFALKPKENYGAGDCRHDYGDYVDAFEQFATLETERAKAA